MSITSVDTDYGNLSVTLIADFDAGTAEVWELWSDPGKLERWMAPPGCTASIESHDLRPGGEITFVMAGPEGETTQGIWRVTAVDPATSLAFTDAFAGAEGGPNLDGAVTAVVVRLTDRDGGTRMEIRLTYGSREDMDKRVGIGEVEGWQAAVGQMDALLAQRLDH